MSPLDIWSEIYWAGEGAYTRPDMRPWHVKSRRFLLASAVLCVLILLAPFVYLAELWMFLKVRKKWWLLPIVFFLVLLGALIVLTQGSALAPFIYAIF